MDRQNKVEITRNDFLQIARLHKTELPDTGFLSECSTNFIRFFYESVYNLNLGLLVISKENGHLHGFALFVKDQKNYMKTFIKSSVFQILQYPSSYLPILRRLIAKKTDGPDYGAELTYIVVDEYKRNNGVANQLITCGEDRMRQEKIDHYHVQVYTGNPAVNLYKQQNFEIIKEFTSEYGAKYIMKKQIT